MIERRLGPISSRPSTESVVAQQGSVSAMVAEVALKNAEEEREDVRSTFLSAVEESGGLGGSRGGGGTSTQRPLSQRIKLVWYLESR